MKKIVAVAGLASLLAGAAFAADISFSYTGSNYFQSESSKANLSYDTTARTDCMSLSLKNDYAGAVVDFDLDYGAIDSDGSILTLDQYYGWMNFAAISTQFTAGRWTSRYVDRINDDAGDLDGEDFELFKPGVISGIHSYYQAQGRTLTNYSVAEDSDNLTEGNLSMFAAYTNADALPGVLMLKAGLVASKPNEKFSSFENNATEKAKDGKYTRDNTYGFAGEVAFRMDDTFNVNLAIKSLKVRNYSFGLFFSPLMVENLKATVGFTLGLNGDTTHELEGDMGTEFAVDLRARYAITEKFSVTTMHNWSSYLTGLDKKATGTDAGKKWAGNRLAMWNMVNLTYAFLDNMTFGLTVNHVIYDFKVAYPDASEIIVSPSVAIAATERANVTIAARGDWTNIGFNHGSEDFEFTIPVIFSYSF